MKGVFKDVRVVETLITMVLYEQRTFVSAATGVDYTIRFVIGKKTYIQAEFLKLITGWNRNEEAVQAYSNNGYSWVEVIDDNDDNEDYGYWEGFYFELRDLLKLLDEYKYTTPVLVHEFIPWLKNMYSQIDEGYESDLEI